MTARIGVIGCGWWATQAHLPALIADPEATVVALADPNPRKLAAAAAAFSIEQTHLDYRELLGRGDLDGVVVAVPHAEHYPVAAAALAADLHVLLEKPMTVRAADAWDLVSLAEARNRQLLIGYTYQFTEHARRAREAVRSGAIGTVHLVAALYASMAEAYYRAAPQDYAEVFSFPLTGPEPDTYANPAVSGGGQAITQITHAIGMVLWLLDERVQLVHALMSNLDYPVDVVDAVSFRLDGGTIGTVASTGMLLPGDDHQEELRLYGSSGFLVQDIWRGQLQLKRNGEPVLRLPDLAATAAYPTAEPARCLVQLITGARADNPAPARAAAATVEFLELAYRSAATGCPVLREDLSIRPGQPPG